MLLSINSIITVRYIALKERKNESNQASTKMMMLLLLIVCPSICSVEIPASCLEQQIVYQHVLMSKNNILPPKHIDASRATPAQAA